jgi:hypothetical protein
MDSTRSISPKRQREDEDGYIAHIQNSRTTCAPLQSRRQRRRPPLQKTKSLLLNPALTIRIPLLTPLTLPRLNTTTLKTHVPQLQTRPHPARAQETHLRPPLLPRRPLHRLWFLRLHHQALEQLHRSSRTHPRRPSRRYIRPDMVARFSDPRLRQRRQKHSTLGHAKGPCAPYAVTRAPQLCI